MNMKLKKLPLVLTVLASACLSAPLYAKDTDVSRLGASLNAMGGERAANADGSIPAWDGGLKPGSLNASATGDYTDPFASEKPLMVISGANAAQYEKLLTPGQMAML